MSVSTRYPHTEKVDGESARLERLPRVRVAQIAMDYLAHGWTADEICRQYPHLLPAEVHAAMTYYFDHQEEIAKEIQTEWQTVEAALGSKPKSAVLLRLIAQGLL